MSFHWSSHAEVDHLHYSMAPGHTQHAGYVQRFGGNQYDACLMASKKWEWRTFNNRAEAHAWLEVTARMIYAS